MVELPALASASCVEHQSFAGHLLAIIDCCGLCCESDDSPCFPLGRGDGGWCASTGSGALPFCYCRRFATELESAAFVARFISLACHVSGDENPNPPEGEANDAAPADSAAAETGSGAAASA